MRKKFVRGLAYVMCATLTITAVPPWTVYAESGTEVSSSKVATPSEAGRDNGIEEETVNNDETPEADLTEEEAEEIPPADPEPIEIPITDPADIATPSEVVEPTFTDVKKVLAASFLSSVPSSSFLGDIWDSWSGKTSFEFLSGSQGEGTEEKPYLIKNREQLMGLSELTAMGMMVPEAEGAKYAGDYSGCYFALGANIDLQGVDWIPIGFYQDFSEKSGEVTHTFNGFFDGNGKTIKNLKLTSFAGYNNVGLFGSVSNANIHDLIIIPDSSSIKGNDRIGVVVGYAENSEIRNVTVKNADISSTGISGGIAGEISSTVIENAICEKVMIDAKGGNEVIYTGGITGVASNSSIIDCEVSTGTGTTARIQGTGYIGGIVGYQNASNVFNTYVSGTIGGYRSTAIGGITGKYAAGKIKVARFAGTIGNSQLGSMAREGTFIGTRQGAATNFNYIEDVAFLFADTESKINANVCGSEIMDDNDYTYAAHIGYWHTGDLYYTLVQGGVQKTISDQYFYEELENGILTVLDEESGDYTLDHFAPDSLGRPVRGYLLNVNQIDTIANGQNFYDIATLEVRGNSQYSKPLNKENRGAIAAGSAVTVTTAPKNTDTEKFQIEDSPFYVNSKGIKKSSTYSDSSHAYAFTMPEENVTVSALYKKVAVSVTVDPESYTFAVVQTRTGNRKNPVITTEIKNKEGKLIARYINGVLEKGTEVQPVNIKAVIDANNDVADSRVKWSIDDPQLIGLAKNNDEETDGYTSQSASLSVILSSSFFQTIIAEAEKKQADENYQYKIPNMIYGAGHQNGGVAVLTAQTRPSTSFEGKPCTANSRINVTFQIIDNTLVATEGAVLDKQALTYTVRRTLTGDRINPQETVTVTAPQSLTATFTPDFFSKDEVVWTSSDPAVVQVTQDNEAYREASVSAIKDAAWIRNIIATDNGIKSNDPYAKVSGSGNRDVVITVDGKDKLGNKASAVCQVNINFVTDDQTRVVPEGITLNEKELSYELGFQMTGDIHSQIADKKGFIAKKLSATVLPDLDESAEHKPYDRTVIWASSDPEALSVDEQGNVTPVDGAAWINEALRKAPYREEKNVEITATTKDGRKAATCLVKLTFQAECLEADRNSETFDLVLTKTGRRTNPTYTWSGMEAKKFSASVYPENREKKKIQWRSSDSGILSVDSEGNVKAVVINEKQEIIAGWINEILGKSQYSGSSNAFVYVESSDGKLSDPVQIILNLKVIDNTTSGGSSGGGGGGGGGGSRSVGVTAAGNIKGPAAPSGAITGTWTQTGNGKWIFASDRTYTDEWAYISNPFATGDQEKASWFRFDKDGFMVTGWQTDADGVTYYLKAASDGTQGQMLSGWQNIDGIWYYFNPVSDGTKGKLLMNTVTPDGYTVNEKGQWIS
ncbi:N-acetylmuramoyl-L-alanine amidase family protein [Lacrimispora sp. 38-1]|uniref:N-acetylmuramoyl-L-alanine amidase family protein n=1 Tax=Lacrimispora sp. 38-1 TaxID=3125778 RepID=UPI003CF54BF0